jgi:hypothetical protein
MTGPPSRRSYMWRRTRLGPNPDLRVASSLTRFLHNVVASNRTSSRSLAHPISHRRAPPLYTLFAMSKLASSVKALINAAHARPGPIPAPRHIADIYKNMEKEATAHKLGRPSWLALSTAATMTMNSPESMLILFNSASASKPDSERVAIAELMREVGLKCIGFNGVRTGPFYCTLGFPNADMPPRCPAQ